jgi:hypothetical protein
MKGKKSGNETTSPHGPGHSLQHQKQEQGIEQMKKDVGQVMSLGIKAIELTVQHMRQLAQRVPVGSVGGSESPDNAVGAQTFLYVDVLSDIDRIIQVDEVVITHLPEDDKGDYGQKQTYKQFATHYDNVSSESESHNFLSAETS